MQPPAPLERRRERQELAFFLLVFGWPGPLCLGFALLHRNFSLLLVGLALTTTLWGGFGLPLLRQQWPLTMQYWTALVTNLSRPAPGFPTRLHERLTSQLGFAALALACAALALIDAAPDWGFYLAMRLAVVLYGLWEIYSIQVRRLWHMGLGIAVDERKGRDERVSVICSRYLLLSVWYPAVVFATAQHFLESLGW